jgi:hypothetical protein
MDTTTPAFEYWNSNWYNLSFVSPCYRPPDCQRIFNSIKSGSGKKSEITFINIALHLFDRDIFKSQLVHALITRCTYFQAKTSLLEEESRRESGPDRRSIVAETCQCNCYTNLASQLMFRYPSLVSSGTMIAISSRFPKGRPSYLWSSYGYQYCLREFHLGDWADSFGKVYVIQTLYSQELYARSLRSQALNNLVLQRVLRVWLNMDLQLGGDACYGGIAAISSIDWNLHLMIRSSLVILMSCNG